MKLLLSVVTLLVGLGVAIGGTFAVFTDTETATSNTFTAGTVDIAVDGENPWESSYQVSVGDHTALKPSQTGYITFDVENVGDNPVHVWKAIGRFVDAGGSVDAAGRSTEKYACGDLGLTSSEPECRRETELRGKVDDISTKIIYDLSFKLPKGAERPVVLIADVGTPGELDPDRGDWSLARRSGVWIYLGVMNPRDVMEVTQSYHLVTSAGNEYQGDTTTFDINLFAGQEEGAAIDPCGASLSPLLPLVLGEERVC
ncbi:MAG: TasA family protein [Chloroflexota bacterium]|nr:TasA family protein [Chloroflexota bacterium]